LSLIGAALRCGRLSLYTTPVYSPRAG
jgi:hypothetical protein